MKWLFRIFIILLIVCFSVPALAPPQPQSCRLRDKDSNTLADIVSAITDNLATILNAVATIKGGICIYQPDKEITTGIGTTPQTVLASKEILRYPNICIYLLNADDVDSFTDADILVSPDNVTFIDIGWSDCDTLTFGMACVLCIQNNAYRYIKATVAGLDGNTVDVNAWITGSCG